MTLQTTIWTKGIVSVSLGPDGTLRLYSDPEGGPWAVEVPMTSEALDDERSASVTVVLRGSTSPVIRTTATGPDGTVSTEFVPVPSEMLSY